MTYWEQLVNRMKKAETIKQAEDVIASFDETFVKMALELGESKEEAHKQLNELQNNAD